MKSYSVGNLNTVLSFTLISVTAPRRKYVSRKLPVIIKYSITLKVLINFTANKNNDKSKNGNTKSGNMIFLFILFLFLNEEAVCLFSQYGYRSVGTHHVSDLILLYPFSSFFQSDDYVPSINFQSI